MKTFKSIKEALEVVGGLSNPSKMPCYSYGLSAKLCNVGSKLAKVAGSVCEGCYALKGMYTFKVVGEAHTRRREAIDLPEWVDAMTFIINTKKLEYFRWHDSGDIQNLQHLLNIVKIAENCPNTKFWMPTRERALISKYKEAFGAFPKNLVVRVSATMVDEKTSGECTSTVHKEGKPMGRACKAPSQDGKCLDCRDCWNPRIKNISYAYH